VIVPDQRGHGRSDAGTPESWNLPTWAADIRSLCNVLGVDRPVILGLSFGGFVARQYAISYPEEIAGLILISTAPRLPAPEEVIGELIGFSTANRENRSSLRECGRDHHDGVFAIMMS